MAQIEKLSGDFNRGYTKAIQDIQDVFNYIQSDLKYHHKNLNGETGGHAFKYNFRKQGENKGK